MTLSQVFLSPDLLLIPTYKLFTTLSNTVLVLIISDSEGRGLLGLGFKVQILSRYLSLGNWLYRAVSQFPLYKMTLLTLPTSQGCLKDSVNVYEALIIVPETS